MAPTAYYGPKEPPSTIFLEQMFLAGVYLSGVTYGAQLVLYVSCAMYLWNVRRSRGNQAVFLLAYMTLLLCVETVFQASQAGAVQLIYVDNRNFPGGPWAYFLATQYLPVNVSFYATMFISTFLADLLVLWRCWVIWSASGKWIAYAIVLFPALMIVASFVMGTLWTLQSSKPGLTLYCTLPMKYGASYYIISLSVNILLTILITTRLLLYRRRLVATLPPEHGRHYFSLVTIIIESAALYSAFALLFVTTYALKNPINQIFIAVISSMQQIASYLIIYRLANGRAWNHGTVTDHQNFPMLRFVGESTAHQTEANLGTTMPDATLGQPPSENITNTIHGDSCTSVLPN